MVVIVLNLLRVLAGDLSPFQSGLVVGYVIGGFSMLFSLGVLSILKGEHKSWH